MASDEDVTGNLPATIANDPLAQTIMLGEAFQGQIDADWAKMDEDRLITLVLAGMITLDYPGEFGPRATYTQLVRRAALPPSSPAGTRARYILHAWDDMWRMYEMRFPELSALYQITYAPNDPEWAHRRQIAYARLVGRVRWNTNPDTKPAVAEAIAYRATSWGRPIEQVKRMALEAALPLALDNACIAQVARIDRAWVTDKRRRKAMVVPQAMRWDLFWRWLHNEIIRQAQADILETPAPPRTLAPFLLAEDPDILAMIERITARLEQIGVPPTERQIMAMMLSAQAASRQQDLPMPTWAQIADQLGMADGAARTLKKRLKERLVRLANASPSGKLDDRYLAPVLASLTGD